MGARTRARAVIGLGQDGMKVRRPRGMVASTPSAWIYRMLVDDAGSGSRRPLGGPVSRPNFTQLAERGLRYNALRPAETARGRAAGHGAGTPRKDAFQARTRRRGGGRGAGG